MHGTVRFSNFCHCLFIPILTTIRSFFSTNVNGSLVAAEFWRNYGNLGLRFRNEKKKLQIFLPKQWLQRDHRKEYPLDLFLFLHSLCIKNDNSMHLINLIIARSRSMYCKRIAHTHSHAYAEEKNTHTTKKRIKTRDYSFLLSKMDEMHHFDGYINIELTLMEWNISLRYHFNTTRCTLITLLLLHLANVSKPCIFSQHGL